MGSYKPSEEEMIKLIESFRGTPQALIISAYMDERKRWEIKSNILLNKQAKNINIMTKLEIRKSEALNKLSSLVIKVNNESIFKTALFYMFGLESSNKKDISYVENIIKNIDKEINLQVDLNDIVVKEYNFTLSNIPNIDRYELAMLENSLFKSRGLGTKANESKRKNNIQ